ALFNALTGGSAGGGAGGGIFGFVGGLFGMAHTGGIIGQGGLASKRVNPMVFASAQRYHSGGIVGLREGEVPIIAMKEEEVLTRDDPRHSLNGGGGTAV